MDFGAFDGSCTSEVRNLIENDIIVSLFSKLLDTDNDKGCLFSAIFDRIKNKANISVKSVLRAVIMDMIRESGDRGTSILNFLTMKAFVCMTCQAAHALRHSGIKCTYIYIKISACVQPYSSYTKTRSYTSAPHASHVAFVVVVVALVVLGGLFTSNRRLEWVMQWCMDWVVSLPCKRVEGKRSITYKTLGERVWEGGTLPETNRSHLKNDGWKMIHFFLTWSPFRSHSFIFGSGTFKIAHRNPWCFVTIRCLKLPAFGRRFFHSNSWTPAEQWPKLTLVI